MSLEVMYIVWKKVGAETDGKLVTYFKASLAKVFHENIFHKCKSAKSSLSYIRLLNLTKSIFWTSLEALSSSWLYVHHQRKVLSLGWGV